MGHNGGKGESSKTRSGLLHNTDMDAAADHKLKHRHFREMCTLQEHEHLASMFLTLFTGMMHAILLQKACSPLIRLCL